MDEIEEYRSTLKSSQHDVKSRKFRNNNNKTAEVSPRKIVGSQTKDENEICINCGRSFTRRKHKKVLLPCVVCKSNFCHKCLSWDQTKRCFTCNKCRRKSSIVIVPKSSPVRRNTISNLELLQKSSSTSSKERIKPRTSADKVEDAVRNRVEETVKKVLLSSLDHTSTVPNLTTDQIDAKSPLMSAANVEFTEEDRWNFILNYYCYYHDVVLFCKFHARVRKSVETMSASLHASIIKSNVPSVPPASVVSARKDLTETVQKVIDEAMVLSTKELGPEDASTREYFTPEDFNSQTYEDLLATAVLNKVIDRCNDEVQDQNTVEGSQELTGTDTDSGLSGSIRGETMKSGQQNISEGHSEESLCSPCRSPKESDISFQHKMRVSPQSSICSSDVGVCSEGQIETNEWNYESDNESPPVQFQIEERIEEITTHHLTDDNLDDSEDEEPYCKDSRQEERIDSSLLSPTSDSSPTSLQSASESSKINSQPSKKTIRKKQRFTRTAAAVDEILPTFHVLPLTDPAAVMLHRVPFPELGMDLVQESAANIESVEGLHSQNEEMILDDNDWEENWLFRKMHKKGAESTSAREEPITMLIPNPEGGVGPTIGDRDVDELSELSDRNSVCSFDSWSGTESEDLDQSISKVNTSASKELTQIVGEITMEFSQKDQEYTEDFSILHRLQMQQKQAPSASNTYNPKTSSDKSLTKNVKIDQKSRSKNSKSSSQQELIPPKGPLQVPKDLKSLKSSSRTVWLENDLQDIAIPSGKTLRLNCQIHARQNCGVSWFFNEELLKEGKAVFTWKKAGTYHLNVFNMTEQKTGIYAVASYTQSDCVWSYCHVSCVSNERASRIPRVTMTLRDLTVEEGSEVTLECQVGGHPEPKVTFIKGGKPVEPLANYASVENDQYGTWSLRFSNISIEDSGQIKAVASNTLGHAMTSCLLSVVPEGHLKVKRKGTETQAANYCRSSSSKEPKKISNSKDKQSSTMSLSSASINDSESCVQTSNSNGEIFLKTAQNNLQDSSFDNFNASGSLFLPPKPGEDVIRVSSRNVSVVDLTEECRCKLGISASSHVSSSEHLRYQTLKTNTGMMDDHSNNNIINNLNTMPGKGNALFSSLNAKPTDELSENQSIPLCSSCLLKDRNALTPSGYGRPTVSFTIHPSTNNLRRETSFLRSSTGEFGLTASLPPVPGTIAEREHRKWLEAKPLPNNPYSPEKLVHRLGGKASLLTRSSSYREVSSVDQNDGSILKDGVPVSADLSRYSRDYHVTKSNKMNRPDDNIKSFVQIASLGNQLQVDDPKSSLDSALVRIENRSNAGHWKEELKDITLDVSKKVAQIQKTIDSYQHEWQTRLNQKGWNLPDKFNSSSTLSKNQRFSSSCINLASPNCNYKQKKSNGAEEISDSNNRHLIYCSTEALNFSKKAQHNKLWRTVSVDTLDSNSKQEQLPYIVNDLSSESTNTKNSIPYNRHSMKFETNIQSYGNNNLGMTSDSDDSVLTHHNSQEHLNNPKRPFSDTEKWQRTRDQNRKMKPYYSENSAESLIEETDDTEESMSTVGEMPNLPSVKELASKFDTHRRHRNSHYRRNHDKLNTLIDTKNIVIVEQNDRNLYPVVPKWHEKKGSCNEIHHSLTARSVSRFFREGLRKQVDEANASHLHELLTKDNSLPVILDEGINIPPRNTPSPEHLGIPSSPALIPNRHYYSYPAGDTSDDSMGSNMMPRKTYRRKTVGGKSNNFTTFDKKKDVSAKRF